MALKLTVVSYSGYQTIILSTNNNNNNNNWFIFQVISSTELI